MNRIFPARLSGGCRERPAQHRALAPATEKPENGVSVQILTNLIEAADAPHATQLALAVSGCRSLPPAAKVDAVHLAVATLATARKWIGKSPPTETTHDRPSPLQLQAMNSLHGQLIRINRGG